MAGFHKKRDLNRIIKRLASAKTRFVSANPNVAVFFDTAIACMQAALKSEGSPQRLGRRPSKIPEEKKKLVAGAYQENSMSVVEIAIAFGLSTRSVNKIRKEANLFKQRNSTWKKEREERARNPVQMSLPIPGRVVAGTKE